MNPSRRPDSTELADYSGVLRRRWWVVIAVIIICLVGAGAYLVVAPKTYTSTAAVYVAPTAADQSSQVTGSRTNGSSVNLDTEAQIVTSGTVAAAAGHIMHSSLSTYQLSKSVSVTVPPNSGVLNISCSAPTATSASACAQAFATAYLQNRSASAAASVSAQVSKLQTQVKSLQKTISTLGTQISALPTNSSTRISDETTQANDKTTLNSLTQDLATLTKESADTSGGRIITKASLPGKPSSPSKSTVLAGGLVAGILLGLIAAFVWDRRDKRLHSAQDVERLLGTPVLLSPARTSFGDHVSLASPRSKTGRAFTELAHTVAASLGEGSHVLLVTGATPGPGVSVVAANLAAALARTHSDAVLVCADLRDSVAPELFGLSESRGLVEVLAGQATVGEVAQGPAPAPGLWVIPPGSDSSLAEYNLQHGVIKALTSQLRRDAPWVVIEAKATPDGADAFALAEFADAAILTVEAGRTRQPEARESIRLLQQIQTPLLGAAVLPRISSNFRVRVPQHDRPPINGGWDSHRNGAVSGRAQDDLSALSRTPSVREASRAVNPRKGQSGPADKVPGR